MFVRPTWATRGLRVACAWPGLKSLSVLCAPFKSSPGAPSSVDTDGAKCVGVGVSAQRTRRGSQLAYTCRLSSSGCPPLLLTLSPSSGPARFAYYGACRGRARPFGRL